ncbi:MAG: hypothetical protein AAFX79_12395 [Planctomycetota bacterium]
MDLRKRATSRDRRVPRRAAIAAAGLVVALAAVGSQGCGSSGRSIGPPHAERGSMPEWAWAPPPAADRGGSLVFDRPQP